MQDYTAFIDLFETIDPPFTLTEETINLMEKSIPIPQHFISDFIKHWEAEQDEFTEYVPILKLPPQKEYDALIYWKASLLKYEYILVTLQKGLLKARKVICSKIIEGDTIKSSAARIDHDNIIYIMAGGTFDSENYNPESSQAFAMEIMEDGDIIFMMDE
jgi:hypothetical protein